MNKRLYALAAALMAIVITSQTVGAAPNAADIFHQRWERYDRPVAEQISGRSWTWGPGPNTDPLQEPFAGGTRTVQYFDKGRMEINDPNGDPTSPWFVTSGLLPIELMMGRMEGDQFPRYKESYVTAIGDPGSFPTYPDLQPLYQNPGQLDAGRLGKPVTDLLNPDLTIGTFSAFAGDPATILARGSNNHGVPQAFIDFQTQRGPVYESGGFTHQQVYDPLYIFGLPITPAVWVKATIGGIEQPVLFQVFERRVLTYNPANPPAFRVEMGNVGQHYQQWRYHPETAKEWEPTDWETTRVQSQADAQAVYILEVDWHDTNPPPGPAKREGSFTLYFSPDGGQTREPRYTGTVGGCFISRITLLRPAQPNAAVGRIGVATQCADSPSESRGVGVTIMTSYDGGRTFMVRATY
jgi:hypothetical protein